MDDRSQRGPRTRQNVGSESDRLTGEFDVVDTAVRSGFGAPSVPAQRNRRARWKDGRLVLGVLLVAITALAGAKLLSSADDTTTIWAAKHEL